MVAGREVDRAGPHPDERSRPAREQRRVGRGGARGRHGQATDDVQRIGRRRARGVGRL